MCFGGGISLFKSSLLLADKIKRVDVLINKANFLLALQLLDQLLLEYKNNVELLNKKAWVLHRLHRFGEAIKCYMEIMSFKLDDIETLNNLANTYHNLGLKEEAYSIIKICRKMNGQHLSVLTHEGWFLLEDGKIDQAVECFDLALRINVNYLPAISNSIFAQMLLKNYDEVEVLYLRAAAISTASIYDKTHFRCLTALYGLAKLFKKDISGEFLINKAIKDASSYELRCVYYRLAKCYEARDNIEAALVYQNKILKLFPDYILSLKAQFQLMKKLHHKKTCNVVGFFRNKRSQNLSANMNNGQIYLTAKL